MAKEIERKFLVHKELWQPQDAGKRIVQGYLFGSEQLVVRVRVYGAQGYLTIKGATQGITRAEFEYEIPVQDAEAMLAMAEAKQIEKTRHVEFYQGSRWEIDVFHGANEGLIVAEIELPTPESAFYKPAWLGAEVSLDDRYKNACLAEKPYSLWTRNDVR